MIHLLHLAHSDFLCFRLPSCWKRAARHSRKPTRHPDGDLFWALRCWAQTNTQTKKHCQSWLEETEEISTRKSRKKDNNPGIGGCFIFIGWFIQLVVCVSSVWVCVSCRSCKHLKLRIFEPILDVHFNLPKVEGNFWKRPIPPRFGREILPRVPNVWKEKTVQIYANNGTPLW